MLVIHGQIVGLPKAGYRDTNRVFKISGHLVFVKDLESQVPYFKAIVAGFRVKLP